MTRRRRQSLLAPTLIAVATCLLVAGCSNGGKKATAMKAAPIAAAPSASTPPPPTKIDEWTLIATPAKAVPTFSVPGGPVNGTLPATWHGVASALPVIAQQPGWLRVRLAQRPNESTAWVLASDMTLATTPYRIVIDLATTHLTLYKSGVAIVSAPIGVGTPAFPTPTGHYFVALFARPPNSGYGPFVMVLSAHSDTITDWESSGDAIVAIHGPLGSDAQIATTGAAVSHGCVRLHTADLQQLRPVPSGTPVDIVAA